MWYGKEVTVTKNTTSASPVEEDIEVPYGMIERVIIFFRPGALGYVKATLWHGFHQFHPNDPQHYVVGDDYVYDMVENYELKEVPKSVTVVAWNTATQYDHTISVKVFVRESVVSRITQAVKSVFGMSE